MVNSTSSVTTPICTQCFSCLGVASRLKLYAGLQKIPKATVKSLTKLSNLKQPTVSYHLKAMADSGLLARQRVGKQVFYRVSSICPVFQKACVLKGVRFG